MQPTFSLKKTAAIFMLCSFLTLPQSTTCLNLNFEKGTKPILISAGSLAAASIIGFALYKFWNKTAKQPTILSDEEQIQAAQQQLTRPKRLLSDLSMNYQTALLQPIEALEVFVKVTEKYALYPLHQFKNSLYSHAICNLNYEMKKIKETIEILVTRNNMVSTDDLKQEYTTLIDQASILLDEMQKLHSNLEALSKKIASLPSYKIETIQKEKDDEDKRRNSKLKKEKKERQEIIEKQQREEAERQRKIERENQQRIEQQAAKELLARQEELENDEKQIAAQSASKKINPELKKFWADPFNW